MASDALRKVAFVSWAGLIAIWTLAPLPASVGAALSTGPYYTDKLIHAALFFVFALLAYRVRSEPSWSNYGVIVAAALLYGFVIEYLQLFIPGRIFDLLDAAADVTGAVAFFVCLLILQNARPEAVRRIFD